jgi:hypothetical protein
MALEDSLRELQGRIAPLERLVEVFAASLEAPLFRPNITDLGFRYGTPDIRHFCLLKAVRILSALNASVELARKGYSQEIAILMRTVVDSGRQIEYVLDFDESEDHRSNVKKLIDEFFGDSQRGPDADIKSVLVRDRVINEQLGKTLDKIAAMYGDGESRNPAAEKLFTSSRAFSLYVHARYLECMDLYGGRPGRFYLRGMSGTPKDAENVEVLDTFLAVANTTFILMVQGLDLRALVRSDPLLAEWERRWFAVP